MARQKVLEWNDMWSLQDRARIANALSVMPNSAHIYETPSKSYIGVRVYGPTVARSSTDIFRAFFGQDDGRDGWYRGLVIYPGWLQWPGGKWTDGLDDELFPYLEEGESDTFGWTTWYQWFPLSTLGTRGGWNLRQAAGKAALTCPNCHLTVPATGVCDFCT